MNEDRVGDMGRRMGEVLDRLERNSFSGPSGGGGSQEQQRGYTEPEPGWSEPGPSGVRRED